MIVGYGSIERPTRPNGDEERVSLLLQPETPAVAVRRSPWMWMGLVSIVVVGYALSSYKSSSSSSSMSWRNDIPLWGMPVHSTTGKGVHKTKRPVEPSPPAEEDEVTTESEEPTAAATGTPLPTIAPPASEEEEETTEAPVAVPPSVEEEEPVEEPPLDDVEATGATNPPSAAPSVAAVGCCSLDRKTCFDKCGTTEDECTACKSMGCVAWLPNGAVTDTTTCAAMFKRCGLFSLTASCCPGLTCLSRSIWFSQCVAEDCVAG